MTASRTPGARHTRDLVKHSAIYGAGQILSRLASLILLPVYTRYLRPADYGHFAILDLTITMLTILVGAGIASAVTRHHFEAEDDDGRGRVWWTGLTFVASVASVVILLAWFLRRPLADLTLGSELSQGAYFYSLVLPTIWFGVVGSVFMNYLRVRKWSTLIVALSLARLLLNIALNLSFLIGLRMGLAGILLGNLLTTILMTVTLGVIFAWQQGRYRVRLPLLPGLLRFGLPILLTSLLATLMHQADRYFLRIFLDMEQVGLYSIAYTIGQGIQRLLLLPFSAIWGVVIYEIAERPDAKKVYPRIFEYFVYGMGWMLLGASLYAKPLLGLLTTPEYVRAADLVPIICLAYLFFSLHTHFEVPVLLAKRTVSLLPASFSAVVANAGLNIVLIPRLGPAGAAWASVCTFAVYSFVGLWRYRRVAKYSYPFWKCSGMVAGMIASYLGVLLLRYLSMPAVLIHAVSAVVWSGWAFLLFGGLARRWLQARKADPVEPLR